MSTKQITQTDVFACDGDAAQKRVTLSRADGQRETFLLRMYRCGEEDALIACIREEYGDTYFKKDFYSSHYLRREAENGEITFLVAQTQSGEIAGMLILKEFFPAESMCEIASQIFKKQYRGYGLAQPFFEYAMEILKSRSYSAAYCLPVLFHDITQRLLQRLGLHATGFALNVFDMEHIVHSYENGRNQKHSQGMQTMALGKRDAGTLYVPEEHAAFTRSIYETLGVRYQLCVQEAETAVPSDGVLKCKYSAMQASSEIQLLRVGEDALRRIKRFHALRPRKKNQTYNVFLNINDSHAVHAYQYLTQLGYFFTGFKSLCSKREFMVLHHPGDVKIYFEDYALTEEFSAIAAYVQACYMQRHGGQEA